MARGRLRRLPQRLQHGETATLVEHLDELRKRLFVVVAALLLTTTVAFFFHEQLIHWLTRPLPPDKREPITLSPAEPFVTSLKVSLYAGFVLSLPLTLWQVWGFLAPAFERSAQRIVAVFVAISTALLAAGIAFGYYIALPNALHFLTNYDDQLYNIQVRASSYFSFATIVLLAVGIVFELPIFILALVRLSVLTTAKLRRNRRIGVVAMVALAVALPGVDPITTIFEAIPLLVLYEASIWAAVILEKRWKPLTEPAPSAGEA